MYNKFTALIDINAWGYAGQQATKLTSGDMETQAAYTVLKTMREVRMTYSRYRPLVLWDGRAQWRFDLYPKYKSNRDSSPEKVQMKAAYQEQRPYIERALQALGVTQIMAVSHEADDMAGILVRKYSADPEHHVQLLTGDQDWLQMVRRNVAWRDIRDPARKCSANNFYEFTGCKTPLEFLERKCLHGDTSDTITGVGGLGKDKGAPELIAQFGSVREFWRQCDAGEFVPTSKAHLSLWKGESPYTKEEWAAQFVADCNANLTPEQVKARAKALKKHMDQWPGQGRLLFRRNFQLMQLLKVAPPRPEDIRAQVGKFDKDAFAQVCEELAFVSILKNLDEFTAPFEGKFQ